MRAAGSGRSSAGRWSSREGGGKRDGLMPNHNETCDTCTYSHIHTIRTYTHSHAHIYMHTCAWDD